MLEIGPIFSFFIFLFKKSFVLLRLWMEMVTINSHLLVEGQTICFVLLSFKLWKIYLYYINDILITFHHTPPKENHCCCSLKLVAILFQWIVVALLSFRPIQDQKNQYSFTVTLTPNLNKWDDDGMKISYKIEIEDSMFSVSWWTLFGVPTN